MNKIIGVRFKRPGKVYFFDAGNIDVNVKDKVIVETAMGQEIGEVIINNKNLANNKIKTSLKPIVRVATGKDLKHLQENKEKEKEALLLEETYLKLKNKYDILYKNYNIEKIAKGNKVIAIVVIGIFIITLINLLSK